MWLCYLNKLTGLEVFSGMDLNQFADVFALIVSSFELIAQLM